jgi:hypothetical protein
MVYGYTDLLSDDCTKLLNAGYTIGLNSQSWEHMVFTYFTPTIPYPGMRTTYAQPHTQLTLLLTC